MQGDIESVYLHAQAIQITAKRDVLHTINKQSLLGTTGWFTYK